MGITDITSKVSFAGNDVTTAFAFTFKLYADSQAQVYLVSALGVETLQTLTTHYTVSLNTGEGGTITMVTAPATGETLLIRSNVPLTQPDSIDAGPMPNRTIEQMTDRLTLLVQQNNEVLGRAPRFAQTSTTTPPVIAEPVENRGLYFDSNGDLQLTSYNIKDLTISSVVSVGSTTGIANADTLIRTDALGYLSSTFLGDTHSNISTTHTTTVGTRFLNLTDSGTPYTVTLHSAATRPGQVMTFQKTTASFTAITIGTTAIHTLNETVTLKSNGTSWVEINRTIPSIWTAFTPTGSWSAYASWEASWKRVGDSALFRWAADFTGTPSGAFNFDIPTGLTMDTSKMLQEYNYSANVWGYAGMLVGATNYFGKMIYVDTDTFGSWVMNTSGTYATTTALGTTVPGTWASGDHFFATSTAIPITNWNG